jgi:hypothetical protein
MLNRFSVLPEVKIAKTQVLPDMNLMVGGLERMEKNYNETASNIQSTASQLADLKLYGDAAKTYGSALSQVFKQKAGELLTKDLGSGDVMSEASGFISKVTEDPELKKHIMAKDVADKYIEQVGKLKDSGKYNPAQSYFYDKAWDHYSKTGQFHPALENAKVEEGINLVDEVPKYFSQLEASGSDAIGYLSTKMGSAFSNGEGGASETSNLNLAYKNSYKGISDQRVQQQAMNIFNSFAGSNAGRQTGMEYDMLVDQGRLDPKGTTKEQYLMGTLLGFGRARVHSVTSTNMDAVQRQGEVKRFENAKENETMQAVLASGPEAYNLKDMDFDSNQNLKLSSTNGLGTRLMEVIEGKRNLSDIFNGNNKGEIEEVKKFAGVLAFAKANGMTDREAAVALSERGNPAPKIDIYKDSKTRKNLTELLYSNGSGLYTTMNYIDSETGKSMSAADIINAAKKRGGVDSKGVALSADTPTDIKRSMDALGIQVIGKSEGNLYTANGIVVGIGPTQYIADISYGGTVNVTSEQRNNHIKENIMYKGAYTSPTGEVHTMRMNGDKGEVVKTTINKLYKSR